MDLVLTENTWNSLLDKHMQTTSVVMNYTRPSKYILSKTSHSKINFLKGRYCRIGLFVQRPGTIKTSCKELALYIICDTGGDLCMFHDVRVHFC